MQQWGSLSLQLSLGPTDVVFEELAIASLPCSDSYSTTLQTISLTRPQGALFIKVKQFLFFEHFPSQQFSVEVLMINGILVNASVSLLAAEL